MMKRTIASVGLAMCALAPLAVAQETGERGEQLNGRNADAEDPAYHSFTLELAEPAEPALENVVLNEEEPDAFPVGFSITYAYYSDYVFRGINFSEYPGEGREQANHQLSTSISVDLSLLFDAEPDSLGIFRFSTFFEWYGQQKRLDPIHGGENLQEIDYTLAWSYNVKPLDTSLTLGYTFYTFPNSSTINTQEWYISLSHNDAWMWTWLWPENEDGVLNPFVTYYGDVEIAGGGGWLEFGISHGFPIIENLTLTPGITVAVDHRWYDPILGTSKSGSTRFAYVQYALTASYDLSSALSLPDDLGSISLGGFLYFNDAVGTAESNDEIQDEFFGGVSVGWSF